MFANSRSSVSTVEGALLTVSGWEWICGKCGEWNINSPKGSGCTVCETTSSEKEISGYYWICPECGARQFAPTNVGETVRCSECRGVFAVRDKREEEQPEKAKTKTIPNLAIVRAPKIQDKKQKARIPERQKKKCPVDQLSFLEGEY
jgi:hypothetical protein